MSIPGLTAWLESAQGEYVIAQERSLLDPLINDIFGFHAVQLGLNQIDFLASSRITCHHHLGETTPCDLAGDFTALPLASQSVDLVILPHTLEFHPDPHQVLREIERVLIPEGRVLIVGFNPLSLWGLRCRIAPRNTFPWNGQYLSVVRLRDWLKLLGFEVDRGQFACFAPPFSRADWLNHARPVDRAGRRWWTFSGGIYVLQALKRIPSMRLITPRWRTSPLRAKALRPLTRKENHGH